ncbi:MAG: hypothetical protein QQN41_06485 [Nitrosopumilus sp.]
MRQCWNCKWWAMEKNHTNGRDFDLNDRYLQEQCRRHSPIANFTVGTISTKYPEWPLTRAIDWCGNWLRDNMPPCDKGDSC